MEQISRAEAEEILSGAGWLPLVPEHFRTEILHRALPKDFAAGEVVYHFGDPIGGIYGLVAGTVAINTSPPTATPRLIHIGAPGFWTGEGCFLTREPRRIEMRALVPTTMMHLPLEAMDQMAMQDPNALRYFALILMVNVDTLIRIVHDLQHQDAARRIASVLHRAVWPADRPIPLSQTEIGVMANASRKQVNAALQRFAKAGWISNSYRAITVLDATELNRFAVGDGT
jgi:CRP-like cAMP-binding protein